MQIFEKYYRVLEVPIDAGDAEIKKAYRRMAKLYHPDRSGTSGTREKFIEVSEAYEVLMKKDQLVREAILRYQRRHAPNGSSSDTQAKYYRPGPRQRATGYADMRFKEFEKTPIYRTAVVINSAANYIFLFIGIVMILSPILGYYDQVQNPVFGKKAEFHLLPIFMGIFFLCGIWYFVFKNKEA